MSLIERARRAGLELSVVGGRLAVEGPAELEPLAFELLAVEREVIAELASARAERDVLAPLAVLPDGADPENPPDGWVFVRRGALAGCWVGPGCELAPGNGDAARGEAVR